PSSCRILKSRFLALSIRTGTVILYWRFKGVVSIYGSEMRDAVFIEHLWSLYAAGAYRREIKAMENVPSTLPKSVWVSKDVKVKLDDESPLVVSTCNCWKA
ncbi:hypothetical protein DXG01_011011, partial [Tephrocybe rancida]